MHVHDSLNLTLCSRSRCGALEAMTVGCKPTTSSRSDQMLCVADHARMVSKRDHNILERIEFERSWHSVAVHNCQTCITRICQTSIPLRVRAAQLKIGTRTVASLTKIYKILQDFYKIYKICHMTQRIVNSVPPKRAQHEPQGHWSRLKVIQA